MIPCVADVSTKEGRDCLVDLAKERFNGRLDILVNNVGTNIRKPTKDYDSLELEFVMRTNFHSCFEVRLDKERRTAGAKRQPNHCTAFLHNDGIFERSDSSIPIRLFKKSSSTLCSLRLQPFSTPLRSSHIPPSYTTHYLQLVASLLASCIIPTPFAIRFAHCSCLLPAFPC